MFVHYTSLFIWNCSTDCQIQQDHKLIQFLMGLNESYIGIKENLLMMTTLLTVSQVYAIVTQEERQREMNNSVHSSMGMPLFMLILKLEKGFSKEF